MAASFSQAVSTFVIPAAQPSDPESVRGSLAQAHAEFERGAVREALRLLRKAAESSDEAGDDLRAVALARAAADLATEVGPTAVPAAPPPPPPAPLPPPASVAPAPTSIAPAAAAPTPAASAVASPLPLPAAPAPAAPAPSSLAPIPSAPALAPAPAPTAAAPTALNGAAARSAAPPAPVARVADPSVQQLLDSGRAVKVVVKRSTRDDGLYIVRLADGHAPALGAREAVVLLLDPDASFFTPPKA